MYTVVGAKSRRGRRCTRATSPGGNCMVVVAVARAREGIINTVPAGDTTPPREEYTPALRHDVRRTQKTHDTSDGPSSLLTIASLSMHANTKSKGSCISLERDA